MPFLEYKPAHTPLYSCTHTPYTIAEHALSGV
jgi:hypothetical protein